MIKIFIDTNILIRGILAIREDKFKPARFILEIVKSREMELLLGEVVIEEAFENIKVIEDKLKARKSLSETLKNYLNLIEPKIIPFPLEKKLEEYNYLHKYIRHSSDLPVVVSAINGNADIIVSDNVKHFNKRLSNKINIPIYNSKNFWLVFIKHLKKRI